MNEKFYISIRISLKFVPKGEINNRPALVQVMDWCRTGDKPLPEPMLTQFMDAYMWHEGEMNQNQNQKSFIQRMYREYIDNMITHVHAK